MLFILMATSFNKVAAQMENNQPLGLLAELLVVGNLPSSEIEYLQDFYEATNGPYWHVNYTEGAIPWDFTADANPCLDNWLGITCTGNGSVLHVSKLVLSSYNLSGSIPDNIDALPYLSDFNLRNNSLSSTIPSTINELSRLYFLGLSENKLTGTLPESIGYVSTLREMSIGANKFHGTIPYSYGNLLNLSHLYVHENELSGHLPPALGNLKKLLILHVATNKLSGSIPVSFGNLTKMREIVFYNNTMTGKLPSNWAELTQLNYIDWGENYFTGTIPDNLGQLIEMEYFYANRNYLTGTIPEELGDYVRLKELLLYGNHLSGTLPRRISHLRRVTDLSLEINHLTGTLDGVFNTSNNVLLSSVTLNNNELTGPLPDELYRLPNLVVLVVGVNCLAVDLTDAMCVSPKLQTLSLDGRSTAANCRHVLFPRLSHAYVTEGTTETEIPPCVFQMASLVILHLSSTGLKGTLPAEITISPMLKVLSLSHNILVGSIPLNFQSHPWSSLDLSYNKLGGTMDSSLGAGNADLSLYLANNRLSGAVPCGIRGLSKVSILGTNLVHCDVVGSELPTHDSERSKYMCGSTTFEVPYYVWLSIVTVVALMVLSVIRYRKFWDHYAAFSRNLAYMRMWLTVSSGTYGQWKDKIKSVAIVSRILELLCRTALWCLAYIMLVLLPLYVAFSYYYNTMTYRYGYTVSAAYLSGIVPAITICVALLGLLAVLVAVYVRYLPSYTLEEMKIRLDSRSSRNLSNASLQQAELSFAAKVNNTFVYLTFGLVNLAVVIGVNYAYIYIVVHESNQFLVISQVCIAFFKLVWSGSGINGLVKVAVQYLVLNEAELHSRGTETRFIMLQILLTLLNNILIPCVVVAVVSESCYYNVFVPAPVVLTNVHYEYCIYSVLGTCAALVTGFSSPSFTPPYKYDYQCASSIIAIYAPAYITLCIMATFGIPLVEVIARRWHSRSDPQSLTYRCLDSVLPRILKPIDVLNEEELQVQPRRYFNVNQMLVCLINLLGLLLTFGAVFPPLAVALTSTLTAVTYFAKLKLGRFLCNAITARRINYVDLIEAECQRAGAVTVLYRSAWILIVLSCLFYSLFIFDTLGDAVGVSKAYWVLLFVPVMPAVIYVVYYVTNIAVNKTGAAAAERAKQDAVTVEMRELGRSESVVTEGDEATFNALLFGELSADARSDPTA